MSGGRGARWWRVVAPCWRAFYPPGRLSSLRAHRTCPRSSPRRPTTRGFSGFAASSVTRSRLCGYSIPQTLGAKGSKADTDIRPPIGTSCLRLTSTDCSRILREQWHRQPNRAGSDSWWWLDPLRSYPAGTRCDSKRPKWGGRSHSDFVSRRFPRDFGPELTADLRKWGSVFVERMSQRLLPVLPAAPRMSR